MVKTWPKKDDHHDPIVRLSQPAMEWKDVDLNPLLATCRKELSRRQFVTKKRVAEGLMTQAAADKEVDEMRAVVEFMVHCVFKAVTRRAREVGK